MSKFVQDSTFEDPEYPTVPYQLYNPWGKSKVKGVTCGKCGLKVKNYEPLYYCCPEADCPLGLGPKTSMVPK